MKTVKAKRVLLTKNIPFYSEIMHMQAGRSLWSFMSAQTHRKTFSVITHT